MQTPKAALRQLPSLARLLESAPFRGLLRDFGDGLVKSLARDDLERLRAAIQAGKVDAGALKKEIRPGTAAARIRQAAEALLQPRPRRAINATGVIVHTNLGRATLSRAAAEAVAATARGYVDLEYDVEQGRRGSRQDHLGPLLDRLFPGFETLVVNNNAAAAMLCLRAHARNREVPVSRGELVEIGGSFRVPDILSASGAKLREIGTTNRTRCSDYRRALGPKTGALLKVHTSNFKIVGFTEETPLQELAALAAEAGVPLIVDWGSGDLIDLGPVGIHDELPVAEILAQGADLVTFSGDKLLGGAQAGFIVGKPRWMEKVRKDPMARAFRIDRLLIAALHATLAAYVRGRAMEEVPTLEMLSRSVEQIGRRAERLRRAVRRAVSRASAEIAVVDGESRPGGGSSPLGKLATRLVAVSAKRAGIASIERALRRAEIPIVARVQEDRLLLDLRTVEPEDDARIVEALIACFADTQGIKR